MRDAKINLRWICLLSVFLLPALSACKENSAEQPPKMPPTGSYLQVDNQYFTLTDAVISFDKKTDKTNFQIGLVNYETNNLLVIEYLVTKTASLLANGEYLFKKSKDLKDLAENKFHNAFLNYGNSKDKTRLDGLAGDDISDGSLKIDADPSGQAVIDVTLTINSKKVFVHYNGSIKYEDFSW